MGKNMPVRYGFTLADGTKVQPDIKEMTTTQLGFVELSWLVGMPRLDRTTLDEFVRRADLYQAYVGPAIANADGSIRLRREDFETLLPVAWTNWTKVNKRDFDARIARERDEYWKHADDEARESDKS